MTIRLAYVITKVDWISRSRTASVRLRPKKEAEHCQSAERQPDDVIGDHTDQRKDQPKQVPVGLQPEDRKFKRLYAIERRARQRNHAVLSGNLAGAYSMVFAIPIIVTGITIADQTNAIAYFIRPVPGEIFMKDPTAAFLVKLVFQALVLLLQLDAVGQADSAERPLRPRPERGGSTYRSVGGIGFCNAGTYLLSLNDVFQRSGRHLCKSRRGASGGGGFGVSCGAGGDDARAVPLDWAQTQNNLGLGALVIR